MHDDIADGRLSPAVLRSFTTVAERLHADHPEVSTETISRQLLLAFHRTDHARVHTFRTLLAERDVRSELARSAGAFSLDLSA
jgi:hypothetical protein